MMEVEVLRLAVYILCRGGGLVERDSCAAGKQESLEHCKCKRLHRKRSIAGYGNRVFSDLAVDLYDKHVKCAYPQAEKHPIFVPEHKHM